MTQETEKWIKMANVDLGVARHLYDTYYPKPLEIICYHCQQAAEKAIKAVLLECRNQDSIPKIHDKSGWSNYRR